MAQENDATRARILPGQSRNVLCVQFETVVIHKHANQYHKYVVTYYMTRTTKPDEGIFRLCNLDSVSFEWCEFVVLVVIHFKMDK